MARIIIAITLLLGGFGLLYWVNPWLALAIFLTSAGHYWEGH